MHYGSGVVKIVYAAMEDMSVAMAVNGSAGQNYCSSWAEVGRMSEQEDALQE